MVSFNVNRAILTDVLTAHGKYPGLGPPYSSTDRTRLHGQLEVIDEKGMRWGSFAVTISFPPDYPCAPPTLFEEQGRIKQEADWHVNHDGSLCLGPEVSELRKYMGHAYLLDWLDRSAVPFLANHLYRERTGDYLNGEFSHGAQGIWEYYLGEWQCSRVEVLRRLECLGGVRLPARNELCYCGSGLPWRSCHWDSDMQVGFLKDAYANDLRRLKRLNNE